MTPFDVYELRHYIFYQRRQIMNDTRRIWIDITNDQFGHVCGYLRYKNSKWIARVYDKVMEEFCESNCNEILRETEYNYYVFNEKPRLPHHFGDRCFSYHLRYIKFM